MDQITILFLTYFVMCGQGFQIQTRTSGPLISTDENTNTVTINSELVGQIMSEFYQNLQNNPNDSALEPLASLSNLVAKLYNKVIANSPAITQKIAAIPVKGVETFIADFQANPQRALDDFQTVFESLISK